VHCAPASLEALAPYLSQTWLEYATEAGIRLSGLITAYPPGAPTTGGRAPANFADLNLPGRPELAILNCLSLYEVHRNPYWSAAVASALNDWLRFEWLDRDDRLRASLIVSKLDIESAVEEIGRLGPDQRFVQVLLPVRTDAPYGNRRYWPLYEAATRHGLAIGLHAWGRAGNAPTPSGFTTTYVEDYVSNAQIAQIHVLSLVSEGVFARFADLRVTLLECGFGWLPTLLWRFDKDWKSVWREVPWVKGKPSEHVRRHFRATTAPAHLPADLTQAREVTEMVGTDWLLYASDHPHDHGPSALLDVLDGGALEAVLRGNAERHYPRLAPIGAPA
jgi:predicted TIM-barrel fold metal-dependent hydrolase